MVAIKDGDQITRGLGQRLVDVAGFCVRRFLARQVRDAHLPAECTELFPTPVIQDIDVHLVLGPVHLHGREHGGPDHVQWLVIGRDKHVDRGPFLRILRQRIRPAVQRPQHLEIPQDEHQHGVELGQNQTNGEEQVDIGDARHSETNGFGHPPIEIPERGQQRDHHQADGDQVPLIAPQPGTKRKRADGEDGLPQQPDGCGDDEPDGPGGDDHGEKKRQPGIKHRQIGQFVDITHQAIGASPIGLWGHCRLTHFLGIAPHFSACSTHAAKPSKSVAARPSGS